MKLVIQGLIYVLIVDLFYMVIITVFRDLKALIVILSHFVIIVSKLNQSYKLQ